ncbi:hypothetical protein [Enhygromyxa salina]|uniref:hypothetical protein n=1 Tax=Enhygromyxa salina TaxID=215803 RepID=UPI0011BADE4D|nr:hypothetical protein [Enhygromyxa salina]
MSKQLTAIAGTANCRSMYAKKSVKFRTFMRLTAILGISCTFPFAAGCGEFSEEEELLLLDDSEFEYDDDAELLLDQDAELLLDQDAELGPTHLALDIQQTPSSATATCYIDNDWTGSTACWQSVQHSSWLFDSRIGVNYYYNDVRHTTNTGLTGKYSWIAPASGSAAFYVWIPSSHATANTYYLYYCKKPYGQNEGIRIVNQANYFGVWVLLGSVASTSGYTCAIEVRKDNVNNSSEKMAAMDGAKVTFTY